AKTGVGGGKPRAVSAGHRPGARSRGGSPTNSLRTGIASHRAARATAIHHVGMNPLAIPMAHGHIAFAVWATPRIAALPEEAASARESAKGGGPGVGPLRRVRHTEPGIHAALHICA